MFVHGILNLNGPPPTTGVQVATIGMCMSWAHLGRAKWTAWKQLWPFYDFKLFMCQDGRIPIEKKTVTQFVRPDSQCARSWMRTPEMVIWRTSYHSLSIMLVWRRSHNRWGAVFGWFCSGVGHHCDTRVGCQFACSQCYHEGAQIYHPEKSWQVELLSQDVLQILRCAGQLQYNTYGKTTKTLVGAHTRTHQIISNSGMTSNKN